MSFKNLFGAKPQETITIYMDGKVVRKSPVNKPNDNMLGSGIAGMGEQYIKNRKKRINKKVKESGG